MLITWPSGGRPVGGAENSKEFAEWRMLKRKNLSILGLLSRKKCPQCLKEKAVGRYARAAIAKWKKNNCLSRAPDRKVGKSQGEREPHLGEIERIRSGAWRGKGGLHRKERQVLM